MRASDFRTFADLVVTNGFEMAADTVIIDITRVPAIIPEFGGYRGALEATASYPPFTHCFLEAPTGDGWMGIYTQWHNEGKALYVQPFLFEGRFYTTEGYACLEYDPATGAPAEVQGTRRLDHDAAGFPDCPATFLPLLDIQVVQEAMVMAAATFYLMHQRSDLDAVTYTRQQRRKTERLTGKAPSPHYILYVNPKRGKIAKSVSSDSSSAPLEKAPHRVRGHFRINPPDHPISHFAGRTFWIGEHERGSGEGEAQAKIYRIVLPEKK